MFGERVPQKSTIKGQEWRGGKRNSSLAFCGWAIEEKAKKSTQTNFLTLLPMHNPSYRHASTPLKKGNRRTGE